MLIISGMFGRMSCGLTEVQRIHQASDPKMEDREVLQNNTNHSNKSPIQILPSRFPPPIEALLERIQNYFSTYNHPELQNKPPSTHIPQVTSTETTKPTPSSTTQVHPAIEEITTESTVEEVTENINENGTNYIDIYIWKYFSQCHFNSLKWVIIYIKP